MTNKPLLQEIEEVLEYAAKNGNIHNLPSQSVLCVKALTRLRELRASVDVEELDEAIEYMLDAPWNRQTPISKGAIHSKNLYQAATKLREIVGK